VLSRYISSGLVALGVGFLALAGVESYCWPPGPALTIDDPNREVAVDPISKTCVVTFRVHNHSHQTIRVVGLAQC